MNETRITATELARNLSDILNRARYRGERFVIERNGEAIASVGPIESKPGMTLAQLAEYLREHPFPDEEFARDLEAVQAAQPKAEFPEWPC